MGFDLNGVISFPPSSLPFSGDERYGLCEATCSVEHLGPESATVERVWMILQQGLMAFI
jgi:hypothetical protein